MAELHDLAPFYVLDALSDDERAAFERHLESCADCRIEIARLDDGVEVLVRSVAEPAPSAMKAEVMAAIDGEVADEDASETVPSNVSPLRPRTSTVVASLVAAAAVIAVVLGVGLGASDPVQDACEQILQAENCSTTEFETDVAASAVLVYAPDTGRGAFVTDDLEPVADDRTYQLWLIDEGGPASAGVFRPQDDGSAGVLLEGEVRPGLTLGLTVEPEGGSEAPTGDILLAGEI